MKIVIAANFRMLRFVSSCVKSTRKLGYPVVVYDLGGLGFGKPFKVDDPTFQKKGYYRKIAEDRYAPSDHKPAIIKDCLNSYNEFIIYLDADTVVMDRIDEMVGDYDIGLTVRPEWEVDRIMKRKHADNYFIYDAYVNAGVMCFNATEAAYRFVEEWQYKTEELHEDQAAINDMLKKYFPLKSDQIIERKGVKIRTFDALQYNYYYFKWPEIYKSYSVTENDIKIKWQNAKILHFKGKARPEYFRIFHPFRFYFMPEWLSMEAKLIKKEAYKLPQKLKKKLAWYRWFVRVVKGEASILDPLYKLSKKLKGKFVWYRHFVAFIKGKR